MAGDLIDVGNIITSVSDAAGKVFDRIWPDKTAEEKAKFQAALESELGQLQINRAEAANANWFVAGWRPFVGWICGSGLAYQYLLLPLGNGIYHAAIGPISPFPPLDVSTLMQLLMGMLGLGAMRTYEKINNVQGKH